MACSKENTKDNIVIAIAVIVSFIASYCFTILPYIKELSGGTRTIIITVVISSALALIKPVVENEEEAREAD